MRRWLGNSEKNTNHCINFFFKKNTRCCTRIINIWWSKAVLPFLPHRVSTNQSKAKKNGAFKGQETSKALKQWSRQYPFSLRSGPVVWTWIWQRWWGCSWIVLHWWREKETNNYSPLNLTLYSNLFLLLFQSFDF